jgi:iron complex transport system ATP-binding protein
MGRAPHATTPADDDLAVAEAMARAEVTDFALRPFSALSGGERARVALARVLARRAPLPLFDEPTAAFDLRHQELVLRLFRVPRGDVFIEALLSDVHDQPVEVFPHPRTGAVAVTPKRPA